MLTTIFKNTFGITLSLTPVIILLLALSPMLKKRYTPKLPYFIWMIVAIRLLLPVPLSNIAMPHVVIPAGKAVYHLQNDRAVVARAFAEIETASPNAAIQNMISPPAQTAISWIGILAMVWMAGVCVYLIWQLVSYGTIKRRFTRWSIAVRDQSAMKMLEEIRRELGIKKEIGLYQSEHISGPLLIGFIRPSIIFPMVTIEDTYLRGILRHELLHFRRGDLWYKLLLMFATSLNWFNPVVYLMARQAEMDMELACDSDVLMGADNHSRKEYGHAILSLMEQERAARIPLTTYFFSSKNQIKQRFLGIVDASNKRKGLSVLCISMVIVIAAGAIIGCGYLTAPLTENAEPDELAASSDEEKTPLVENSEIPLTEPMPINNDVEIHSQIVPDMQEMERLFLSDLENNQEKQAETQQNISQVYEHTQWSTSPYVGGEMAWPVPGFYMIASEYGMRFEGTDLHTGMDISGAEVYGKDVIAVSDGIVKVVNLEYKPGEGYGIYVIVDHGGGVSTLYAQLSKVSVSVGDEVKKGQEIAQVGSTGGATGSHLHFEVRLDGTHVNPKPYLL